ncbi:PTS glucitol/sorbitol transporter subunit IIA [Enterococcus faecalis]|uniref:PTS glucitol/sorbitol transporter subunit IIA n=1 Tax=Enterococcus faecalis TaxID=1351 RepID=A0A974NZH3_ENTFL|nr:PTS glucitol/sorbitol transporter subunit IIA [Enterococcus faecalis]
MQATVTEIGKHAIDDSEKMIILFGETATDTLKQHAVIQSFPEKDQVTLAEGDHLKIGDTNYTITKSGFFLPIVTLQSIAHSTLIFADAPTDEDDVIRNGVYLTPHQLPKITIGTTIDYLVNGA